MQINIGSTERMIRLIAGVVLVLLPFIADLTTAWTWVSMIVGLVLIATGVLRFCPAWAIFGINTCRRT